MACVIRAFASARCTGVAFATLMLMSTASFGDAAVISIGDLLFQDGSSLLATSPTGVTRTEIQLASIKNDLESTLPSEQVYPGSSSEDGLFSFHPADFNRPVTANKTLNRAFLIVTDLVAGKVKQSIEVPLPGLSAGTNINFEGTLEGIVAAGSLVNGEYSLFLVIGAPSCKDKRKVDNGDPYDQKLYTKYTYNASTGTLSWAGVRQTIYSNCAKEKPLVSAGTGLAVGASGSTGFLLTGSNTYTNNPRNVYSAYKLSGSTLSRVYSKPASTIFESLTLLSGGASSDSVKFAGTSTGTFNEGPVIRLFGYAGSMPAKSSKLTGFKFEPDQALGTIANNGGGSLVALTQGGSTDSTYVYSIGPFALNVTGGRDTPTTGKKIFTLNSERWSGSVEVVGKPVTVMK